MTDRRSFLKTAVFSALGGAAMTNSDRAGFNPSARRLSKIGLQLYTVRKEMERDFAGTLKQVASIGFKEVEFAGYFNRDPKEVKTILSDCGLTAPSAHTVVKALRENLEQTIEITLAVGHSYLICAYLFPAERRSLDDYKKHAALFNQVGERCRRAGLQFGYHNHDFEFASLDGQVPFDVLLAETDAKLVQVELDLYWITKAEQSPAAYFAKHPGRFPLFHVKDMDATPKKFFTEVGRGTIDFKKIFEARNSGVKHHFVEQDECPGSPFESIRVSYEYLRQLEY
jgi:sugar phosphate isomerase/epimerase